MTTLSGPNPVLSLWVPGKPLPKPRPRVGAQGQVYSPDTGYEERVATVWAVNYGRTQLKGPLVVSMVFVLGKTPGTFITVSPAGDGPWHIGRADLDNLVKGALDGLSAINIDGKRVPLAWLNDRQVVRIEAQKVREL